MKLVEKVVKIKKGMVRVGEFIEVEDTLSCNKFRGIVSSIDDYTISMFRLKDYKPITLTAEQLEECDVKIMVLGYVNENSVKQDQNEDKLKQATKDKKISCEYNIFEDLLKELNTKGVV